MRINSPVDGTALCVALGVEKLTPDELALRLEREHGICCRPGLQCAPTAHRHLGTFPRGCVRLSPGWGNTVEEMETAIRAIDAIARSS